MSAAAATTHAPPTDPKYDNYDYPIISPSNQSGHPGHTTPQQDASVYQLRTVLEQSGHHERLDTLTMVRVDMSGFVLWWEARLRL